MQDCFRKINFPSFNREKDGKRDVLMASTMHRHLQKQMSEQRWEVADAAIEAAEVFMNSNMDAIPAAGDRTCNRPERVVMQNVIFAIGTSNRYDLRTDRNYTNSG